MSRADVAVGVDALLPDGPVLAVAWLLLEILDAAAEFAAPARDVLRALLVVAIVVPIARQLSDEA